MRVMNLHLAPLTLQCKPRSSMLFSCTFLRIGFVARHQRSSAYSRFWIRRRRTATHKKICFQDWLSQSVALLQDTYTTASAVLLVPAAVTQSFSTDFRLALSAHETNAPLSIGKRRWIQNQAENNEQVILHSDQVLHCHWFLGATFQEVPKDRPLDLETEHGVLFFVVSDGRTKIFVSFPQREGCFLI